MGPLTLITSGLSVTREQSNRAKTTGPADWYFYQLPGKLDPYKFAHPSKYVGLRITGPGRSLPRTYRGYANQQ
jgi:hypothetical protein